MGATDRLGLGSEPSVEGDLERKIEAGLFLELRLERAWHESMDAGFPGWTKRTAESLHGIGEKVQNRLGLAEYAVGRLQLALDLVGLDAALREERAVLLLARGRPVPGLVQAAHLRAS